MATRNVVLTDHQNALVDQLVTSGHYQNASEVLREGLRLVEIREAENAARLDALRNAVDVGMSDFAQGRYTTFESAEALGTHLANLSSTAITNA